MKSPKSITPQAVTQQLDQYFSRIQKKAYSKPLQVRVFSSKVGLDYAFPSNSTQDAYHTASIGKMFTAVVVQRLAERGIFSIQDPICKFFSESELERLFIYKGTDYAQQVTAEHLLGHTSGIADYFEGRTIDGRSFLKDVLTNTHRHWTPQMLVDYTRDSQRAVGVPGQRFNYSDTGYILLGLLIEKLTGKSFAENLEDEIFWPLAMHDSYLMFYEPAGRKVNKAIAKLWVNGVEGSQFQSLSCDWAGGGIITTTADLLKFSQALHGGRLVQPSMLETMEICHNKFRPGIYYGLGMMEIRFKEFFFLLGKLPKVRGHIGILATHLFYDPTTEAHIILNFGDTGRMVQSFRALIQIETILQKMGGRLTSD